MVVAQAVSDFSTDVVPELVPDPVLEPADFINTSQSNYSYLQASSMMGHGQGHSNPKMSGSRPGSKRKHTTETSTIVLRHGLLYLKWDNGIGFFNKHIHVSMIITV